MADDQVEIRELIQRWAAAVHAGDMAGVLADHAADILMFDVPPPEEGVRGLDAYRQVWTPFFEWQQSGASSEIVTLYVTAGEDVAFAWALLRCGTGEPAPGSREPPPPDDRPSQRGRQVGGRARAPFVR